MADNLHGKKLAYHYLRKVTGEEKLSTWDITTLIVEICRAEDRVALYEKLYRDQLIANHTLRQENKFLTKELGKYDF